ncbi:hypothetical protein BAOM_2983 [Peribacillus asahii]|uniref:Uncharacterized protein n=1 Tax=Peribacillus asahii TaxID=228899 RepID=A0A3T0KT19_9BACI|nr:hypothetical protein [Peribacillus asahii]AZV43592.1 hypothetical protein BAOM_2983 [Peribacillus asahii]
MNWFDVWSKVKFYGVALNVLLMMWYLAALSFVDRKNKVKKFNK